VKVGRGGAFRKVVPGPRRVTNRNFYAARIGTVKAKRVKLQRRTVLTTAKVVRGRVVIRGHLVKPLLKTRQTVVIRREISCNRRIVVGRGPHGEVPRVAARAEPRPRHGLPDEQPGAARREPQPDRPHELAAGADRASLTPDRASLTPDRASLTLCSDIGAVLRRSGVGS
jgi:hypothetical protein